MNTLKYNNYEIAYQTAGDPTHPCIVCLHPAFGDHRVFEDQFVSLSDDYFLIGLDMLGHGQTQPGSTSDQMDETIEHIRHILDHYQISRCHLLGVSLGALVVQSFADRYPQLTLSVTAVGGYSIHRDNKELQKAQSKEIFSWILKLLFNMNGFREYIAKKSTYRPEAYARMLNYSQAITRKSLMYMQGMGKLFVEKDLPVSYPLWVVYGEHEIPMALAHGSRWVADESKARLTIIEGAGHCANMEVPDVFNKHFREFLRFVEMGGE